MIVERKYYKGFKIRINNTSAVPYVRLLPREKIIEYNPEFFGRIHPQQEYYLLEWAIRNKTEKNLLRCDFKTLKLFISKGYDRQMIIDLYETMSFRSKQHKAQRLAVITGNRFEDTLFFKFERIYLRISDFLKMLTHGGPGQRKS